VSENPTQNSQDTTMLHPYLDSNRSTGTGYHVITRQYASGDVEALAFFKNPEDKIQRGGHKRQNKDKKEMLHSNLQKSQARARRMIRRKTLSLNADRMLTLTFRENLTDIDKAWEYFKRFNLAMKREYPERWRYVAVPEYQKRGAVHFHLAISGRYNYNHIRKIWWSIVGEGQGNIDITDPKKYQKNSWNPKRIANYLAKYMSKNETVSFNKRRYSSGGKIPEPVIMLAWLAFGLPVIQILRQQINMLTDRPTGQPWEHEAWRLTYLST
jgi:hypothetical protein